MGKRLFAPLTNRNVPTPMAKAFQNRLEAMDIKVYHHYEIPGYPYNIAQIVSDEGYGKNDFIFFSKISSISSSPKSQSTYYTRLKSQNQGLKFEFFMKLWLTYDFS